MCVEEMRSRACRSALISTTMSLVLAVNAGSSSLKISLFCRSADNAANPALLLSSSTSSIFAPPARFKLSFVALQHRSLSEEVDSIYDHESAFKHFLHRLKEEASVDTIDIKHIAHRVVHGGDYISPCSFVRSLPTCIQCCITKPVDTMDPLFPSSAQPLRLFRMRNPSHFSTVHFTKIFRLM